MCGRIRSCAARILSRSRDIPRYIHRHGAVRKAERAESGCEPSEGFAFAGGGRSSHARRSTTREASRCRRAPRDQKSSTPTAKAESSPGGRGRVVKRISPAARPGRCRRRRRVRPPLTAALEYFHAKCNRLEARNARLQQCRLRRCRGL